MPLDDPLITTALETVSTAAAVARSVQVELESVRQLTKDDRSPVTVADFAVQAVVAMDLRRRFGDVPIVGEERADELRDDAHEPVRDAVLAAVRRARPGAEMDEVLDAIDACGHDGSAEAYWTLDPVDGTKGFLRGQQYAVALAWLENGRVVHGVMGCPNLPVALDAPLDRADPTGVLYVASAGRGAWAMPGGSPGTAPVAVRAEPHRAGDPIRACESVEAGHSSQGDTRRILDALGAAGEPARLDSQCKYAVVARGQADAYLRLPTRRDYVEKIWDHAAGSLIASEAGAAVSDVAGRPLHFGRGSRLEGNRGIICAARGLHERIVAKIGELGLVESREP